MDMKSQLSFFEGDMEVLEFCRENKRVESINTAEQEVVSDVVKENEVVSGQSTVMPFELEDPVHVRILCEENDDPESYYYLKDFEGKSGVVKKVITSPSLQYEVSYSGRTACLYHRELEYGTVKRGK